MKKNDLDINEVKKLGIIFLVVLLIFGVVYLLTLGATKLGWFNEHYTKKEVSDASIQYDYIMAGTILNRSDKEYYVLITDVENNTYLTYLLDKYNDKEDSLPSYIVDLGEGLNKSIIGEDNNISATSIEELSIKDSTLLKISNSKIVKYIIGNDDIEKELNV